MLFRDMVNAALVRDCSKIYAIQYMQQEFPGVPLVVLSKLADEAQLAREDFIGEMLGIAARIQNIPARLNAVHYTCPNCGKATCLRSEAYTFVSFATLSGK